MAGDPGPLNDDRKIRDTSRMSTSVDDHSEDSAGGVPLLSTGAEHGTRNVGQVSLSSGSHLTSGPLSTVAGLGPKPGQTTPTLSFHQASSSQPTLHGISSWISSSPRLDATATPKLPSVGAACVSSSLLNWKEAPFEYPFLVSPPHHMRIRLVQGALGSVAPEFLLPANPSRAIWDGLTWPDLLNLRGTNKGQCLLTSTLSTHTHYGRLWFGMGASLSEDDEVYISKDMAFLPDDCCNDNRELADVPSASSRRVIAPTPKGSGTGGAVHCGREKVIDKDGKINIEPQARARKRQAQSQEDLLEGQRRGLASTASSLAT